MRKFFLFIPILIVAALAWAGCGDDSGPTETGAVEGGGPSQSAHAITPELKEKILADATEDLEIISAAGSDKAQLAKALKGRPLDETIAAIDSDLAEGKVRKRDYRNINVRLQDYISPTAQVFAEFDDYGYYVDAATGEPLTEPGSEHRSYALAMTEEDGRWKIYGIYSATGTTTATTALPDGT